MIRSEEILGIIPARGGSKGVPRKNIRKLGGKPLIAHTIEAALGSGYIGRLIVSTDDEEIAEVSKTCGAEVPFMRPVELSNDHVGTAEVMVHAVNWIHEQDWRPEAVGCIYATSVFLTVNDLKKGFDALSTGNWMYAFSVTDFEYPIFRSSMELPEGGVEMFFPENLEKRSQDLPEALHDAAQFYLGKPDAWLDKLKVFERHSYPVKLPRWRIQDIDTDDDWKRAEILFELVMKKLHDIF